MNSRRRLCAAWLVICFAVTILSQAFIPVPDSPPRASLIQIAGPDANNISTVTGGFRSEQQSGDRGGAECPALQDCAGNR